MAGANRKKVNETRNAGDGRCGPPEYRCRDPRTPWPLCGGERNRNHLCSIAIMSGSASCWTTRVWWNYGPGPVGDDSEVQSRQGKTTRLEGGPLTRRPSPQSLTLRPGLQAPAPGPLAPGPWHPVPSPCPTPSATPTLPRASEPTTGRGPVQPPRHSPAAAPAARS